MTKKKILLVDDEVSLTRILAMNLEDVGGYEVRRASTGRAGLAAVREDPPDLILLDLMMPDLDGSEVAAELANDPATRHIPIVFLTAVVQKAEVQACAGVIGGRSFLAKPVRVAEVVECIERHLGAPSAR